MRLVCLCGALLIILSVVDPTSARRRKRQTTPTNDLAGGVLRELSGFINGIVGNSVDSPSSPTVLAARDDIGGLQSTAAVQSSPMAGFSSCLANMANNFLGGLIGGPTPTSSAVLSPAEDNSILLPNAQLADSPPSPLPSSDVLSQSELSERVLNGFSARERGRLQSVNLADDHRSPENAPNDIERQRRNMEVLLKLRERHLAKELARGVAAQAATSSPVQLIEPQISPSLFRPTTDIQQILGTGPRRERHLDTGGLNFDRVVMHENNDFDALGNSVVGNWKESGLQWTDGDLKLLDVKGNNVLGKDITVRDRSVDIPVRSWWNYANRLVPLPAARPEHPAAFLAG
uniref:Uncharacterized protein n=1 Tax=Plectus sambesii TaxID=2011161 RepID=A0A914W7F2_9BILA